MLKFYVCNFCVLDLIVIGVLEMDVVVLLENE